MTKLSDTQRAILGAATQREDRNVLPLPGSLRGGAAAKVVGALLSRGLIAETRTESRTRADAALNRIWRNDEDGRAILLHITDAGLAAIGIEPDGGDTAPTGADEASEATPAPDAADEAAGATKTADAGAERDAPRLPRAGTKQARLIEMLRDPRGHTIAELAASLGWENHTLRGAIAGALKKRLGLDVRSERIADRGKVFWIPADE